MDNISCQQLTEGLKNIQELKIECDNSPSSQEPKDQKIARLSKLKEVVTEVFDLVAIRLPDKRILFRDDYNSIIRFAEKNDIQNEYFFEWIGRPEHRPIEILNGRIVGFQFRNQKLSDITDILILRKLSKLVLNNCIRRDYNNRWDSNFFDDVPSCNSLTYLDISDAGQDAGLIINFKFLEKCGKLKHLNIQGSNFNQEDLKLIPSLKSLNIKGCWGVRDLSPLLRKSSLKDLYLSGSVATYNYQVIEKLNKRGVTIHF